MIFEYIKEDAALFGKSAALFNCRLCLELSYPLLRKHCESFQLRKI
jgi:hypothetical protein